MKRKMELWLALTGIIILGITILFCFLLPSLDGAEKAVQILAITAALLFFAYKLLAGWLFINLNVKIEPERMNRDANTDHLVLKLTLEKGNIDSLWLKDIQFRCSEITETNNGLRQIPMGKIKPIGMHKTDFSSNGNNDISALWEGEKQEYYVLSPNENGTFSTYTTVAKGKVILVEVIVLGTRPFYGIQDKLHRTIQWRSSLIVLPIEDVTRSDLNKQQGVNSNYL
jgi:hypothetical protein